jgi:hypothetical protein
MEFPRPSSNAVLSEALSYEYDWDLDLSAHFSITQYGFHP